MNVSIKQFVHAFMKAMKALPLYKCALGFVA